MCPVDIDEVLNCKDFYPGVLDVIPLDLRKNVVSLLHEVGKVELTVENVLERSETLVMMIEKQLGPQRYVCEAVVKGLTEGLRRKGLLEDAVELIRKRSNRIKSQDFGCQLTLAAIYQNAGEYFKTVKPCQEMLDIAKKMEDPLFVCLAQAKLACNLWHTQEPEEAKRVLSQCIASLDQCNCSDITVPFTEATIRLLDIYKTLRYIHQLLNQPSKAAEYAIKAYEIVKKDEKALVQSFKMETQLAAQYAKQRDTSSTQMYSLSAYEKIKEVVKSQEFMTHHVLNVIHSLSRVVHSLQIFEKSERVLAMREELYEIGTKYLGEYHPEVIRIAADTSYLCMNMKNIPKQDHYLELAESAFKIGVRTFDDSKMQLYVRELGDAWKSLGLTYTQLRRDADAERCYKEAVVISTRVYGGNHPRVARLYRSLGVLYRRGMKYTQALEYFQKCRGINDEFYPGNYQLRKSLDDEIKSVKNPRRRKY